MEKEVIKNIFKEIDNAMETTQSDVPVTMKDSKFLKKYNQIKERYLNG